MAELIDLSELQEKVTLVVASTTEEEDTPASLDELEELTPTAGAITVARIIRSQERVCPNIYLGKSRIDEVRELLRSTRATDVICNGGLSSVQLKNLKDALDIRIMDRITVIPDIFTSWVNIRGGKIQVELAQLKYRAARLVGMCNSPSRLGGGIGTRSLGEKKLGTDHGLIHQQINQLKEELTDVKHHQEVTRQWRERNFALSVVIVGYTNIGKFTLLNRLTGTGILAKDKLFATLDPTTRSCTLGDGQQILLTDTVGFIRKLPRHLVGVFKSTLKGAYYSDIVLRVVDYSNPQMDMRIHVVKGTLEELEIAGKTIVTVFNKANRFHKLEAEENSGVMQIPRDFSSDYRVRVSARAGGGLEGLQKVLQATIRNRWILLGKASPYSQAGRVQITRKHGQLLEKEYQEGGIVVRAYIPTELFGELYSD